MRFHKALIGAAAAAALAIPLSGGVAGAVDSTSLTVVDAYLYSSLNLMGHTVCLNGVVVHDGGEDDPYPAGAVNTANAIITLAGAKNAFADLLKSWDTVSWEEVVTRNPDVIWLMTAAGSGYIEEAEGIKQKLAADPRLTNVTAVRNAAYVIVSYNEGGVASPRNVDAIEHMIDGLIALK